MINKEEFKALMASCLVPELLNQYMQISGDDYLAAIHTLYNSELYSLLANKNTKLFRLGKKYINIISYFNR